MPDSTSALINQLTNPPNPFQQFGATVDFANKLKDFQAQKAISDIYSQSIDPTTGQVDFGKFNALASQNPAAMWKLGASQQQAGQGQQALSQGTSEQLATTQRQLAGVGTQLAPLVAKIQAGESVTKEEVQAALEQAKGLGLPASTINNIQRQLDAIPPGGTANSLVLGMNFGNSTGQEILKSTAPGTTGLPVGSGTLFVSPNRLSPAGNVAPGNYVPSGLTPENKAALQKWLAERGTWQDAAGKFHTGTNAEYYSSRGQDPYAIFGNNNVPAPGSSPPAGPVSTVTTGRAPVNPPAAAAPGAPSGGAGASAPGAPAPGVMGTLPATPPTLPPPMPAPAPGGAQPSPPAQTPAPSIDPTVAIPPEQIEPSRKAYFQDQDLQSTLGKRVGPLESAISTLRAHPNMQTVGQDEINQLTQVANAFGFKIGNLNDANAYQELSKYLEGYLRNLPGANRSDLSQNQAAAASPHIGQGREPMQALLAKAIGYERLQAAGYDYFNSQYPDATEASKDSGQYKTKTASWMAKQDPIAYAVDEMTPQQYASYVKGLSDQAKNKLKASRNDALKLYPWLYPPGMAPVAPQAPAGP